MKKEQIAKEKEALRQLILVNKDLNDREVSELANKSGNFHKKITPWTVMYHRHKIEENKPKRKYTKIQPKKIEIKVSTYQALAQIIPVLSAILVQAEKEDAVLSAVRKLGE